MRFFGLWLAAVDFGAHAASIGSCPGYKASNIVESNSSLTADLILAGDACNAYGTDLTDLKLLVEYQTDSRLHVIIYDAAEDVYHVQESYMPRPGSQSIGAASTLLEFKLTQNPFSFSVVRKSNKEVLFDTNGTQLVFESQYVRLRTKISPEANLYGLGENSDDFRLPSSNYQRTLWNADSPYIPSRQNLYGSHPVYYDHRGMWRTHAVFLLSASGMDINIDQTSSSEQYLEYNTIGGVLDFYFLAGPDPISASQQYAEIVGFPAMNAYWTLGFHQCKYGYHDVGTTAQVVANYSAAGIPLETLWADIDYMANWQDFTTAPDRYPLQAVRNLVASLHARGQHYVMMVDPGIHRVGSYGPLARGSAMDVFLKAADGSPYRGLQWPGEVVFPDWFAPNTQSWWNSEFAAFFDPATGVDIDGVWNDMNEVASFCGDSTCNPSRKRRSNRGGASSLPAEALRRIASVEPDTYGQQSGGDGQLEFSSGVLPGNGSKRGLPGRNLFFPQYKINNHRGELSGFTLFTNVSNADGSVQYDTHNLYGTMMARASRLAMLARRPNRRPFVLTRSTFAGIGAVASHWFGDNESAWADYRASISMMLAYASLFQTPMVGSDICGFNGQAEERMCARWAMLGAFQPFMRNHADISASPQEFYLWPSVTASARRAIDARYRLLDYIYTAMHAASQHGTPLVSPLWFAYPADRATYDIQYQWLLGNAVLVSPVINSLDSVTFYLPDDVFYDFWTRTRIQGAAATTTLTNLTLSDIPVHIRGGTIVPLRVASANTTALLRQNNFTLLVAPARDGSARGNLYLDDGDAVDVGENWSDIGFTWDGKRFDANGTFGFDTDVMVEEVTILGDQNVTKRGPWSLRRAFEFVLD